MKQLFAVLMSLALSSMFGSLAHADDDSAKCAATIKLFQGAGESASSSRTVTAMRSSRQLARPDSASAEPTGKGVSMRKASR